MFCALVRGRPCRIAVIQAIGYARKAGVRRNSNNNGLWSGLTQPRHLLEGIVAITSVRLVGQRQRIAVARALVADPRILIFDEATSALDYESERAIQQNMKQIAAGRTVFIIAHRLSTVRTADRIITLEAGRVVEDGSHDELIHSNGATRSSISYRQASMAFSSNSIVPFPRRPIRRHDYELAFLLAALEIAETPPSPVGRAIGATIIAIFCVALTWATFGRVDIVATATGKIIPSAPS
jgi:hypothetical protein